MGRKGIHFQTPSSKNPFSGIFLYFSALPKIFDAPPGRRFEGVVNIVPVGELLEVGVMGRANPAPAK